MSTKPFPDLSDCRNPRSRLHMLREFVLNHEGPIATEDARRLMAATLAVATDLVGQTHSASKFDMDRREVERLLLGEIAMYERPST